MTLLLAGIVLFFGAHSISIFAEGWRNATVGRLGEGPWKGLYSLASLAGFVMMLWGFSLARHDGIVLYSPPEALKMLAAVLMVPVFPLLFAVYLPGRIKSAAKHPMLLATKFWALAHLFANGRLADVLLFGAFLAWAVADRISFKRRTQRPLPGAPAGAANDAIALVLGLGTYALLLFWGHSRAFGVSPLPP
jgi:uncharacterized membrane protein